ncbi:hypothetical protein EAF07_10225 [Streptococcus hillyeri]|uniref:Uncharacterized protein n=1 Tax=Streptococcus hillyeri TaxID=2282420 RepID=A0A3L9DK18_9STRE|nr:hypothetical protein EAF07_10225 [Streptococcus hillyeri]
MLVQHASAFLYLSKIKNYFFASFLKVRTLQRSGRPFEVGNEADEVSITTSYGVSLLLFDPLFRSR